MGLFLLLATFSYGQEKDTIPVMSEVVVSGIRSTVVTGTSMNIRSLSVGKMRQSGAYNISDALAKLPGVSQISTGVAISKPVIRGLYGNRILAVLSGLKFDNQQWQDEHGLGLGDMGIDRVEVIKGPASLLYGSEAVGGILNIIEEAPAASGTKEADINTGIYSNTLGLFVDAGIKKATATKSWGLRVGLNSNADYSDGNGKRIMNSRFTGYYLKLSKGFKKKNWESDNHFNSSWDNFGFITADNSNSFLNDGRWSRSMKGPHHVVLLNVLSSQNNIRLKHSTLSVNAGLQSNLRLEDEGGGSISLNMLLSTFLWRVQWNKQLDSVTELILSNNFQFENNTNFGAFVIIPDANMIESGLAAFIRRSKNKFVLEAGIGGSVRNIHTLLTDGVNSPEKMIPPFNKTRPSLNGSIGISWLPTDKLDLKANVSSGFRTGNLAELSSNGLHEGTLRFEIGDPDLKIEQNINSELSLSYTSYMFQFSVAGFLNHFGNYIYLAPTGTTYVGFDVFRYLQKKADLYGGECMLALRLPGFEKLRWETNFSTVTGKLDDGSRLPFIPPSKWSNELKLSLKNGKKLKGFTAFAGIDKFSAQDHPALFESNTGGYWLLNGGFYGSFMCKQKEFKFSIAGNNLLNKNYYDHLSRFKDYGIHDIGRNIVLRLNIPIY